MLVDFSPRSGGNFRAERKRNEGSEANNSCVWWRKGAAGCFKHNSMQYSTFGYFTFIIEIFLSSLVSLFVFSLCIFFIFIFVWGWYSVWASWPEEDGNTNETYVYLIFCWWAQTLLRFASGFDFCSIFVKHLAEDLMVDPWDCFPLALELHRLAISNNWIFFLHYNFYFSISCTLKAFSCLCTTSNTSLTTDRRVSPPLELLNDVLCLFPAIFRTR